MHFQDDRTEIPLLSKKRKWSQSAQFLVRARRFEYAESVGKSVMHPNLCGRNLRRIVDCHASAMNGARHAFSQIE